MHMPPPVHGASMVGKYIHDSKVVNSKFECHYLNPTTAKNLEDVNKFRFGKVLDVFGLIKRIKAKVREVQPDLVYFTANAAGMPFYKDFLIVRALKQMDCKVVVHYHNKGVATRQNRFVDDLLYRSFFKDIKNILLAENLYNDIKKYVRREDVQICGNGIPDLCSNKSTISQESSSTHSSTLHLLYLSNMMAEKGVWTLLDACVELKNRKVDFHCDFVGGWKDVQPLYFDDAVTNYGLETFVTAHGAKYGDEKEPFFENADVMVFPTYYHNECFPLVLLEGMMHGLACVSTQEAGIPGIIDEGKTGFMVSRRDAKQLADTIEKLANDRNLCNQMGIAGRKKYEAQFTLPVFEHRITACLKNLL